MRAFVQYGAVPAKKAIVPRAQCYAAVRRGEYPDVDTCLMAAASGAIIPPATPDAPPSITDSPVVKYAGIALAAAVVLGGGYLLFKKDRGMTPNRGLTKRQRAARRGARTRELGSTVAWDVRRKASGGGSYTFMTVKEPGWKSSEQLEEELREQYPGVDLWVGKKKRISNRRRRRR